MKLTLVSKENIAGELWTFRFKPQGQFSYIAGQFIELTVPHTEPDDRGTDRWFTLCSSPTEELLSITTRLPEVPSTYKARLGSLKIGSELVASEPLGDFVLPLDTTIPLVFVAAGIGCTPFHSMAQWIVDTGEKRQVHIVQAARIQQELVWGDLFKSVDPHHYQIIEEPGNDWHGDTGRLTTETIQEHVAHPDSTIYISGPEPFVELLTVELGRSGIPSYRIMSDYFPGYKDY